VGLRLEHERIMFLIVVFIGSLPISYSLNVLVPLGLPISDAANSVGMQWTQATTAASLASTILASLFIASVASLFIVRTRIWRIQVLLTVFLGTFQALLIMNVLSADLRATVHFAFSRIIGEASNAFYVAFLAAIIMISLLFTFIAWILMSANKTRKTGGAEEAKSHSG